MLALCLLGWLVGWLVEKKKQKNGELLQRWCAGLLLLLLLLLQLLLKAEVGERWVDEQRKKCKEISKQTQNATHDCLTCDAQQTGASSSL